MSYPQKPGEITLYGGMNKTLKIMNEPSFDESENTTNILYPFNAFAKTGSVTVSEVYTINKQSQSVESIKRLFYPVSTEAYLEAYQSSIMELLRKILRGGVHIHIATQNVILTFFSQSTHPTPSINVKR